MFDLAKFDQEIAFDFEQAFSLDIRHPITGEKTGLVVEVVSYRSERVKRVQRRLANATIRENKKNPLRPVGNDFNDKAGLFTDRKSVV